MKMRELEKRTGVNRETIRVYLRHGLMPEPQRPAQNVANYGEEHVRAVLSIRQLQKEKHLPLHLIKRAMEGDTSVMPRDASAFPHLDSLIAARVGVDDTLIPLVVTADNPHAEKDAQTLDEIGAIKLVRRGGKTYLSRIDIQLVSIWRDMRAAGFTEELGFTPHILKLHVDAAEQLAQTELKIFLDRIPGQADEDPTADMAQAALTHLLSFFGMVRVKAVLADLRNRADARARQDEPSPGQRTRKNGS